MEGGRSISECRGVKTGKIPSGSAVTRTVKIPAESAVIIGGGTFPRGEFPRYLISSADVVICCDSAVVTYLRHFPDRLPDMVIGDMDSIPAAFLRKYKGPWKQVADQQTNDQTKAFNYLIDNWCGLSRITFIGAVGRRADHTIANLSLLTDYATVLSGKAWSAGADDGPDGPIGPNKLSGQEGPDGPSGQDGNIPIIESVSDSEIVFPMLDSGEFSCGQGRGVSIFTPDPTLRIKSSGLQWPTEGVRLDSWWKASLNRACCDVVKLEFSHPAPVLIVLS